MLERFQEQIEPVNETLIDRRVNKKYENLVIYDDQKEMLNNAIDILQPFYDATHELSGIKYPTISVIIPIFQS